MTPEESDARLRQIHDEWRRWCAAHPATDFRWLDDAARQEAMAGVPKDADEGHAS